MSDQIEMDEDDKGASILNSTNQGGEKKRFEVKKVIDQIFQDFLLIDYHLSILTYILLFILKLKSGMRLHCGLGVRRRRKNE